MKIDVIKFLIFLSTTVKKKLDKTTFIFPLSGHFVKAYKHEKSVRTGKTRKKKHLSHCDNLLSNNYFYLIPVLLLSHGFHMLKVHISTVCYNDFGQRIRFVQEEIDAFLAHIRTTVKL